MRRLWTIATVIGGIVVGVGVTLLWVAYGVFEAINH